MFLTERGCGTGQTFTTMRFLTTSIALLHQRERQLQSFILKMISKYGGLPKRSSPSSLSPCARVDTRMRDCRPRRARLL
eukprot:3425590-Rhodomonas_salina.1